MHKHKNLGIAGAMAAAALLLSACGNSMEERAGSGALIGAGTGAVLGGNVGSTVAGGLVGAGAGAVLHETKKRN